MNPHEQNNKKKDIIANEYQFFKNSPHVGNGKARIIK